MTITDVCDEMERKGLTFYSGDGQWNGDPDYSGKGKRKIIVKYCIGDKVMNDKEFKNGDEALRFCFNLSDDFCLWHGSELVIGYQRI